MTSHPARRRAGVAAMLAGGLGLVSLGFLVAAIVTRAAGSGEAGAAGADEGPWTPLFRGQDAAVALQSLLMLFVIRAAWAANPLAPDRRGRVAAALGVLGHAGVVLSVALVLSYRAPWADMLYMFPQGLIGVWLVALVQTSPGLSLPLRATGAVAGLGLVLLAVAAAMIASALGWQILDPTSMPSVEADQLSASGNRIGHVLLPIGTLLGRALYPVWNILLGRQLLRERGVSAGGARTGEAVASEF